jgi:glycerophosphoryl diester phosphodiesterase
VTGTVLRLPRVIGHRGAAAHAPENTLAGFRRAAELGAEWVELDVRLSADGVPVVFHDDALDRTTNGRGPVADMTLDGLKALDAGAWFGEGFRGEKIPTLAEAVGVIAGLGLGLNIEVKPDPGREAETARKALAVALAAWPRYLAPPLVSSFRREALAAARDAAPEWPRGLLAEALPGDWREAARDLGCVALHLEQRRLTAAAARTVRDEGLGLLAYTVNEPERAQTLWGWGVQAVFTDRPDRLAAAGIAPAKDGE